MFNVSDVASPLLSSLLAQGMHITRGGIHWKCYTADGYMFNVSDVASPL